ncbi:MAG: hypothetical protein WBA89_09785 [Microcoleus sp.]|uniref:hypothetical protein n=1 Tax=Microcoleus sp. TaxID=44472 RepID=UPI003C795827
MLALLPSSVISHQSCFAVASELSVQGHQEEGRGKRADRAIDKTPPPAIALNPLLIRSQHHFRLCQFSN